MKSRMLILPVGPVPPGSGPVRKQYLLSNGTLALRASAADFAAVADALRLDSLPNEKVFFGAPFDSVLGEAQRVAWARIGTHLDRDTLAQQRSLLGSAVNQAVRALNYLEDSELAEEAHAWVHLTARLQTALFGCRPWVEDGDLWSDCAVRVSHERWGCSVEMTTAWNCSICGSRFDSCPHDPDSTYEVVIARATSGQCSACAELNCDHQDGEVVETSPLPVAASISAGAIAIVDRPRYPDARPTQITLPIAPNGAHFDNALEGNLHCTACLGACPGWSYFGPT